MSQENNSPAQVNGRLWKRFWALAKPYWVSEAKLGALGLLGALLLLVAAVNVLNVLINYVGGDFMTALSKKDAPQYWLLLKEYGFMFVIGTPIVVMYSWMQDKLSVYWRRWLTKYLLDKYFRNRAFYQVSANLHIDNPDERLAQDINAFTRAALNQLLNFLSSFIQLFSFIFILWTISHFLVWITIAYSIFGTVVTLLFGTKLVGLNFQQLRREADLRYGLTHVRNHVESIAFYQGEEQEKAQLLRRFAEVFKNFNALIGWNRNLNFFTTGFNYFVIIIPSLVIAPLYFAGKVEFGVITQAGLAFSMVLGAFAVIVTSFQDLTNFAAVINRLGAFNEALDADHHIPGQPVIESVKGKELVLQEVSLSTPDYRRVLVKNLSLAVKKGEGLLIKGRSGTGKSSLLRAFAGLWDSGSGRIIRPDLADMLFLPQRPYMLLGSLRDQLLYPAGNQEISDNELLKALDTVNLGELVGRVGDLNTVIEWADFLSLGEQQRLAFARVLLSKPKYVILDEATSDLDEENEERLYKLMQASGTTYVSVGHRSTLHKFHQHSLYLKGDGGWSLELPAASGS